MLDRATYHELALDIDGASLTAAVDGRVGIRYTLGTRTARGPNGAAPNPDLFPENNPVLRPPVRGRVGLWAQSDSSIFFEDDVVDAR